MLSRILKRSYHNTRKFTDSEAVTNFIIKSIENTNYNSAQHCLNKHSESLSLSNIQAIDITLKKQYIRVSFNMCLYIFFGQFLCYITDMFAIFPMVAGPHLYILDCINHEKLDDVIRSIKFSKEIENDIKQTESDYKQ